MNFGSKIIKYQDAMMQDLAKLVAIPSVNGPAEPGMPFGKPCADVLNLILQMARDMGLAVKNVGNYAGHAEYGEGPEAAAVVTHVDVVPAGEGWETDPFTLTRKGNLYLGRGAADDKGASIAALYGLKVLKEEAVAGNRRIRAIFGAGEETGSNDLAMYFNSEETPVMAFTPDSEYGICNREKGMLRVRLSSGLKSGIIRAFCAGTVINAVPASAEAVLQCSPEKASQLREASQTAKGEFHFEAADGGVKVVSLGKASHAMQPQDGFNAASALIRLLSDVFTPGELGDFARFLDSRIGLEPDGASLGIKQSDKESGPLTLNLGLVHMDAEEAWACADIRYPVTSDGDAIFAQIKKEAGAAGLNAEVLSKSKPLYLPGTSPLITLLSDSYAAVTGSPAELYSTGGGTYARAIRGRAVAFGPFFPDEPDRRLHNSNESIDIERFMTHAQICLEAMYRMLTA